MENSRIDLTRNVINSTVARVMKKNVFQNAKIFIRFFFYMKSLSTVVGKPG